MAVSMYFAALTAEAIQLKVLDEVADGTRGFRGGWGQIWRTVWDGITPQWSWVSSCLEALGWNDAQ